MRFYLEANQSVLLVVVVEEFRVINILSFANRIKVLLSFLLELNYHLWSLFIEVLEENLIPQRIEGKLCIESILDEDSIRFFMVWFATIDDSPLESGDIFILT